MLLTHEDQTVDLDLDYINAAGKVGVSLSGGADSALLLYLVAKYCPDVAITPYCAHDSLSPKNLWAAEEILYLIKQKLPNSNIGELYSFYIDCEDPEWIEKVKDIPNPDGIKGAGWVKIHIMSYETKKIPVNLHINGLTANPPREVAEEWGFLEKCEERRFTRGAPGSIETKNGKFYKPFVNIDKKWVAGMYHECGLMEDIYPLTISCVGSSRSTDYFSKPCGKCFWCFEKQWSFGSMDLMEIDT